ncbi:MAG: HEAT repeat domain-containing protein [Deltaproteobacteria bacterium]|nr:HEAT repeat domain-containing protein [Deltaproteobacteria bacterium]
MIKCPECHRKFPVYRAGDHFITEKGIVFFCSSQCCQRYSTNIVPTYVYKKSLISILITVPILLMVYLFTVFEIEKKSIQTGYKQYINSFSMYFPDKIKIRNAIKFPETANQDLHHDPLAAKNISLKILEKTIHGNLVNIWEIQAAEVLAQTGNKIAIKKLIQAARNAIPSHRMRISEILAKLGDEESYNFLRKHMNNRTSPLHILSTFALGRLGDKSSIKHLRKLMMMTETRFAASEAIAASGDSGGLAWLYAKAKNSRRQGDRVKAACVLARLGDKRVKIILKTALEKGSFKFASAVALGHLGDKSAVPVLEKALKHPGLRIEASYSLADLKSFNSYTIMEKDLSSDVYENRVSAAISTFILLNARPAEISSNCSFSSVSNINEYYPILKGTLM